VIVGQPLAKFVKEVIGDPGGPEPVSGVGQPTDLVDAVLSDIDDASISPAVAVRP
jgi:hypothetical protein